MRKIPGRVASTCLLGRVARDPSPRAADSRPSTTSPGNRGRLAAILPCIWLIGLAAGAHAQVPEFDQAQWIWFAGDDTRKPPAATRYFRAAWNLPAGLKPKAAELLITADNLYTVWLNGKPVGESETSGSAWRQPKRFDVSTLVAPGRNVLAVEAINTLPGAAGLLVQLVVRPEAGAPLVRVSDSDWRATDEAFEDWESPSYLDVSWSAVRVVGPYGCGPWKKLEASKLVSAEPRVPLADPQLPGGVLFVRGNVSKPHHFALNTGGPKQERKSFVLRAYPESDVPSPAVLGRQMFVLQPARPGVEPRLLVDAQGGSLGSPSVSYDAQTIYFAMAPEGEAFYHLFSVPAAGGPVQQLTRGPFHDYDPEPLPDGRIAFSSTRIGSREEYHGNLASSIFTMRADGSAIQPLTHHIVADREPRVTAFGSLVMVRADNFLERAKVETQLHHVHLDGTGGTVILGNERGPIGYQRGTGNEGPVDPPLLRFNGFGSPAPLPDGRVAALSRDGLVLSGLDPGQGRKVATALPLFDIAAVSDGRLVATVYGKKALAVVDPQSGSAVPFFTSKTPDIHSVVHLGPRRLPPTMAAHSPPSNDGASSGYLYCQNVRNTKHAAADAARIAAVRIYEGVPLALRPDHYPYEHIGVEARELGTIPLAADGSFYARVPADRALAIQAVDGEGRAVVNELSWIYVRPGERRSCVGCHSPRAGAPTTVIGLAHRSKAVDALGPDAPHRFRGNNAELGGILNLQLDRMREAASIDLYSQHRLAGAAVHDPLPPGRPALVATLCRQLDDAKREVQLSALQRLALLHDRAASERVALALDSPDPQVRMHAALCLSACGARPALDALAKALDDRHPEVARAAVVALANLTGRLAADQPASSEGEEASAAWRRWLADQSGPRLEQRLIAQLAADDPAAVIAAADALGHVGSPQAVAPLQDMIRKHLAEESSQCDVKALMAAMRALGHLRASEAIPLLGLVLALDCRQGGALARRNVHLAATAAEALGRIGTSQSEEVLVRFCGKLESFAFYSQVCGDHPVLRECHASILHYRILEAFDALGTQRREVLGPLLRSLPGDLDRGLLVENDGYETLLGRVVQRCGLSHELLQTCLAVLQEPVAPSLGLLREELTSYPTPQLAQRKDIPLDELFRAPRGGLTFLPYTPVMRSAQMISVLMLDDRCAAQVVDTFHRYRRQTPDPIGDFRAARDRAWVCFYLARALGRVRGPAATDALLACLQEDPPEAALGRTTPPHPMSFVAITPFHRAAAAYGLGLSGERRALDVLLRIVSDMDNALDVRHSAARGLILAARAGDWPAIRHLAADYPETTIRRMLQQAP